MLQRKKNTLEVACALLVHDGKVLLAQRDSGRYNAGLWEFPGGKLESGENAVDALKRELEEELALSAVVPDYFCRIFHEYPTFFLNMDAFVVKVHPEQIILKEHVASRWVRFADVWKVPLAPADVTVAQALLESILPD
ncbi:MAG: (deoxy)nucleoside triphosphate pyrophosphohydrolase [Spirochaetia bacterium]|jgi:mutator protein MutT|nr:(deoxy)nucleoside triphosphate pyrophosphohydrolase [Spirochaetia bacterium]